MQKDIISKESIKIITKDIARYILDLNISDELRFIDKELRRIEKREADLVALCKIDNQDAIIHIEIQNNNDSRMVYRMLRYYIDIKSLYKNKRIYQYVIYIGKDRVSMQDSLEDLNINFKYNLIDMSIIDCNKFIKLDNPDALILAILCNFKNRDEKELIAYIIKRLRELTKDNDHLFAKYLVSLETLSENRDLRDKILEVESMLREIKLEELPSFRLVEQRGIEQGIERGIEQGIERGIERGIEQEKMHVIQKSLQNGLDVDLISKITGVDKQEIIKIQQKG